MLVPGSYVKRYLTKTVTNIFKLSSTHLVSNIRYQNRCNRNSMLTLSSTYSAFLWELNPHRLSASTCSKKQLTSCPKTEFRPFVKGIAKNLDFCNFIFASTCAPVNMKNAEPLNQVLILMFTKKLVVTGCVRCECDCNKYEKSWILYFINYDMWIGAV